MAISKTDQRRVTRMFARCADTMRYTPLLFLVRVQSAVKARVSPAIRLTRYRPSNDC
jgi:hypothetical protein